MPSTGCKKAAGSGWSIEPHIAQFGNVLEFRKVHRGQETVAGSLCDGATTLGSFGGTSGSVSRVSPHARQSRMLVSLNLQQIAHIHPILAFFSALARSRHRQQQSEGLQKSSPYPS